MRFVGVHEAKVDKVGRLTVPRDVRDVLEAGEPRWTPGAKVRLILAWGDLRFPYLTGYTFDGHQRLADEIDALDPDDPRAGALTSMLIEKSETLRIDDDGRCVLGRRLRDRLGMGEGEGQVVFAGRGGYLRLWPAAAYDAAEAAAAVPAPGDVLTANEDAALALRRRRQG